MYNEREILKINPFTSGSRNTHPGGGLHDRQNDRRMSPCALSVIHPTLLFSQDADCTSPYSSREPIESFAHLRGGRLFNRAGVEKRVGGLVRQNRDTNNF